MEQFKYILDPGSKKFMCPSCNKRTFVKFIDSETQNYLSETFGRCDRESNCSYYNAPDVGKVGYLIEFESHKIISDKAIKATDKTGNSHLIPKSQILESIDNQIWISEWYLKKNSLMYLASVSKIFCNSEAPIINTKIEVDPIITETSLHELELLDKYYNDEAIEDNLTKYLSSLFGKQALFEATQKYFLTGINKPWRNSTVFWQIDNEDNIHGAKIMLYDASTGKRKKEPYNHINWLHKALKMPEFNLNQCLFGLQRINEDLNKVIALVESEKTAIVMSLVLPDVIWLATGSKQNLKLDLLKPLKGRKIILYPDKGEFQEWQKRANEIKEHGFKIEVSDILEHTEFNKGFDLADYYLRTK